jgi:dihydrofolate synthase/folylpolyglutamate synthase
MTHEQALRGEFETILSDYDKQLAWLNSLITDPTGERYLQKKTRKQRLRDYGQVIERTTAFLEFLGKPQEQYPSVHIAGTGGKGSVAVMTGAILNAAGFRTGVHTSPYLQVPVEKWMINGKMISPSRFSRSISDLRTSYDAFTRVHPEQRPTYEEAQVALTHQIFSENNVDVGVIETGMGGRYDPTNVLNPDVTVITNVDFDHVDQLGPTLREIAHHKAGIIKPLKPVITGASQRDVVRVIEREAKQKQARVFRLGKDFNVTIGSMDERGSMIDVQTPFHRYQHIRLGMAGTFQAENAAIAITACDVALRERKCTIGADEINNALSTLEFPGRMERVQDQPTVILDGAHNPQKMKSLAETMQRVFPDPYILIVGMLATKDAKQSLASVLPLAKKVIATEPRVIGKPSVSGEQMRRIIQHMAPSLEVEVHPDAKEATRQAVEKAKPEDLILITGSLYMLGDVRNIWYPKEEILFHTEFP